MGRGQQFGFARFRSHPIGPSVFCCSAERLKAVSWDTGPTVAGGRRDGDIASWESERRAEGAVKCNLGRSNGARD